MNAKELIEAAEGLHILVCNGGTEYANQLDALALHILATVRADDDEPITREWAESMTRPISMESEMCLMWMGECWSIYLHMLIPFGDSGTYIFLRNAETRSDVRAFLRGIGIELKGDD